MRDVVPETCSRNMKHVQPWPQDPEPSQVTIRQPILVCTNFMCTDSGFTEKSKYICTHPPAWSAETGRPCPYTFHQIPTHESTPYTPAALRPALAGHDGSTCNLISPEPYPHAASGELAQRLVQSQPSLFRGERKRHKDSQSLA